MKLNRSQMVWRAAQDIGDGWLVNLGIGLPVAVADHIPKGLDVFFHSENGVVGVGPRGGRPIRRTAIWSMPEAGRSRCGRAHRSSIPPGRSR